MVTDVIPWFLLMFLNLTNDNNGPDKGCSHSVLFSMFCRLFSVV